MASMHATSAPVRAVRTPAGDPAWSVSGHAEVRALIADSRLSWTTSAAGASRHSQALAAQTPPVDFHEVMSFPLQELVSEVVKPADVEAERTTIPAEGAASHNRVALDQQLIDQLPQIVQQAARGLSGASVTVLNGTDGLGDLTAGLVSQGRRIFDSVRQNLGNDAPGTAPAVRQEGDR
ncbi:hypothetical protein [Amycolatopsis sp. DG1A-15b]|uniref:hypothetical protein n=1 Tax=Amycolatopsis sp. DG1A-15b TaxID=3052846 RepID=UPI00255BD320|nr:hypothetical protein [Amycolatopsis sp. DG1A-15b]WIX90364.1 hypothetical protein QRY02_07995 [Amycolatopsis sp. DG1A-15b]